MRCPICHQEIDWQNNPQRPFCSERCKMIDLGNWADGEYRISSGPRNETDAEYSSSNDELPGPATPERLN